MPVTRAGTLQRGVAMAGRDINELFQWSHNPPIWWDPIPPWVIDQIDEQVRNQLFLKQVELQRSVLKLQVEALNAQAEILQRAIGS
jgi:hypothetical protein